MAGEARHGEEPGMEASLMVKDLLGGGGELALVGDGPKTGGQEPRGRDGPASSHAANTKDSFVKILQKT